MCVVGKIMSFYVYRTKFLKIIGGRLAFATNSTTSFTQGFLRIYPENREKQLVLLLGNKSAYNREETYGNFMGYTKFFN